MTRLSDYTTEELERLTTLTEATAKPGEFIMWGGGKTVFKTTDGVAYASGWCAKYLATSAHERRVISFTDATELDPPQAEMLAELARRKAPPLRFRKGDVVAVVFGGTYAAQGHLATACDDVLPSDTGMRVEWDTRVPLIKDPGHFNWWGLGELRLPASCFESNVATPADIAAYEARIPKASAFKVGELVVANGGTYKVGRVPSNFADDAWATDSKNVVWMCNGDRDATWEYAEKVRPATDAEVAAYHRAHCQPKPAPVVISNATHAGQWVKWLGRPCKVLSITNLVFTPACGLIAVADEDGCVCHIRPNEAILIDPPTWPK